MTCGVSAKGHPAPEKIDGSNGTFFLTTETNKNEKDVHTAHGGSSEKMIYTIVEIRSYLSRRMPFGQTLRSQGESKWRLTRSSAQGVCEQVYRECSAPKDSGNGPEGPAPS